MDPISIALMLGGMAASAGGALITRNEGLQNAQAKAAARNAVLMSNVAKQQGFADTNRGAFDTNIAGYAPGAQGARLGAAQDGTRP